jgi:DNA-binding IscR family transcriptional regulator
MAVTTTNDVFRKIREISLRVPNPRPSIPVNNIASELNIPSETLVSHLAELKDMRLIKSNDSLSKSISLTLLGSTVKRDK